MADNKMTFTTIEPAPTDGKVLGSRKVEVDTLFSSSPINSKSDIKVPGYGNSLKFTADGLKKWFLENVVNGSVPSSDAYYGFPGSFSTDFKDAPDMTTVKTGGGGLPATPFVPNPSSPGSPEDGTINVSYSTIPAADAFAAKQNAKVPNNFGSDLARTGIASNSPERNPVNSSQKTNLNSFILTKGVGTKGS